MVKISKKELKGLIGKILEARIEEKVVKDEKAAAKNKADKERAKAQEEAEKKKEIADDEKELKKTLAQQRTLRKEENEDIEEGHCTSAATRDDGKKKMKENEELEEGEVKNPGKYKTGMKAGYDDDGDGVPNGADKNPKDGSMKESKIQTPEQEQKLYESRFSKRNDEIFDKLKKLWTK